MALRRHWVAFLFAASAYACGGEPPKTVSVRMRGTPDDARVIVDDVYIGALGIVAARGIGLPPGKHTISIEAPGYFPNDRVVTVRQGDGAVAFDVHLQKLPE